MPKAKKPRKIAIITGTRAEYGYVRPIIKAIEKRDDMDYGLIVTNMHLLDAFGYSITDIYKDKAKIAATVYNTFDGYNRLTMVKSLAVFQLQLPEILQQMEADMVLVPGDRGEQLMAAIVGAHMYLPVAHIQGGELSGNIDGSVRHAITKMAHIHFAANQDAADRILKMGEEAHRVHAFGAPMLDDLLNGEITPAEEIYKKFSLKKNEPSILFVFHSVTEEMQYIEKYMDEIISALNKFGLQTVVLLNNSDAGSTIIRNKMEENKQPFMKFYKNVPRADYAGLLNVVDVLVGNSSSGILEAPSFKLPSVNIGNRQKGRMQGINIVNADYNRKSICDAVTKAMSAEFKVKMKDCVNPYGDGKSAQRIVKVLADIKIDDNLLVKNITY